VFVCVYGCVKRFVCLVNHFSMSEHVSRSIFQFQLVYFTSQERVTDAQMQICFAD